MNNSERNLSLKELLEEIDNGSITSTSQLDLETVGLVHDNPNLISGVKQQGINNKPLKVNLKLTKQGIDSLRLYSLSVRDIDNSFGKDSIKVWLLRPLVVAIIPILLAILITEVIWYQKNKHQLQESSPKPPHQEHK